MFFVPENTSLNSIVVDLASTAAVRFLNDALHLTDPTCSRTPEALGS